MKKIFIWSIYTDTILLGKKPPVAIGGADIQLAFWAKQLALNGYSTYTFSIIKSEKRVLFGVRYFYFPLIRKITFFLNWLRPLFLLFINPDVLILRSVPMEYSLLSMVQKLLKIKMVYMLASDNDVTVKKTELTKNQLIIKLADFVICQNDYQYKMSKQNLKLDHLRKIPNIWDLVISESSSLTMEYDFIWVSNIRQLKRPSWFIELARNISNKKFAIIGAALDEKLYKEIEDECSKIPNITILGYQNLYETTRSISKSKILVCTSEFEGFPNTFLQAFNYNIPIISTVNPNDIITKYKLGLTISSIDELVEKSKLLIENNEQYEFYSNNIASYFSKTHSPNSQFEKLKGIIDNL